MSEIRKMSIWDFECLKCQEEGRTDTIQLILGAATSGKAKDNEVLCGFCDDVIFVYTDEELETYEEGSVFGDNEDYDKLWLETILFNKKVRKKNEYSCRNDCLERTFRNLPIGGDEK